MWNIGSCLCYMYVPKYTIMKGWITYCIKKTIDRYNTRKLYYIIKVTTQYDIRLTVDLLRYCNRFSIISALNSCFADRICQYIICEMSARTEQNFEEQSFCKRLNGYKTDSAFCN